MVFSFSYVNVAKYRATLDPCRIIYSFFFLNTTGYFGHKHSAVTGCVPIARIKDFTADFAGVATDCQIFAVHVYYEYGVNFGYGHYYKLELPRSAYTSYAHVDTYGLSALSARIFAHEAST